MSIQQRVDSTVARIPRGLAIRGLIAIVFGVVLLVWPGTSLKALVLVVGAFAAVDGVGSLLLAFSGLPLQSRWLYVVSGIAGLAVGAITFASPDISALALLYVIGAWAIIVGAVQIGAAFSMQLERGPRVVLLLYGILAVVFGGIMFISPGAGALALVSLIAAFAFVSGVTLIAAAYEFRTEAKEVKEGIAAAYGRNRASTGTTA